jgi:hypothetical protein
MVAQIDGDYLKFGLRKATRRIASYGLYEGRPLTTKGRFINPVVFAWLNTLATLPGNPSVNRPIFITGLGRSGTTILGILLSLHKDVGYLNEPKALWHVIDPQQDINGNYSSDGALFRMDASHATKDHITVAHRLYSRYLSLTRSNRVVDKYPELIFRIDYVKALFPDAKFIFITRSGADAVPSVVQWSKRLGTSTKEHTDDWWGRNDIKWHYLRKQLILNNKDYESVWHLATPNLDHTNRAALEWLLTMREGLIQEKAHPQSIVRISYEELLKDPKGELNRLQLACNLEPDPNVTEYAIKRLYDNPTKSWPNLAPEINVLFEATMTQLGYQTNN